MSTLQQPEVLVSVTPNATVEVKRFMAAENVAAEVGGLRVSVQPGGCSGFKYSLLIEDQPAEDDLIVPQDGFRMFVDPFSAQYINNVTIDYVTSMQGSGFTFKNPNATGGCGCGSSFSAEFANECFGSGPLWGRRRRTRGPRFPGESRASSIRGAHGGVARAHPNRDRARSR